MEDYGIFRRKLFCRAWIILCMLLNAVTSQSTDEGLSICEIEAMVKELTNPSPEYQMHVAALRQQLRNILQTKQNENLQTIDSPDNDYTDDDKRSLSSLARNGLLNKRYIGSVARSGMLRSQYDDIKRSIATLAKNGQLPSREPDVEDGQQQWEEKRNLGSVARSGLLNGKRNIASLAREYQFPIYGKRNLASLVRFGYVPSTTPKRNMASLARMNMFPTYTSKRDSDSAVSHSFWPDSVHIKDDNQNNDDKRNIGALKSSPVHGARQKRQIYNSAENFEIPDPVVQTSPIDYDEMKASFPNMYDTYYDANPQQEKRFLGSVARGGWYQSRPIDKRNIGSLARLGLLRSEYSNYAAQKARDSYRQQEQKRHIGALARSGWLPSFRPVRSGRFSRSGRARSDTTPNKSDYDNPSRPFVDDAMTTNYQQVLAGEHPAYNQIGEHHRDLQPYIGEVYDLPEHTIEFEQFKNFYPNNNNFDLFNENIINNNNNNNNDDIKCLIRLNMLLENGDLDPIIYDE